MEALQPRAGGGPRSACRGRAKRASRGARAVAAARDAPHPRLRSVGPCCRLACGGPPQHAVEGRRAPPQAPQRRRDRRRAPWRTARPAPSGGSRRARWRTHATSNGDGTHRTRSTSWCRRQSDGTPSTRAASDGKGRQPPSERRTGRRRRVACRPHPLDPTTCSRHALRPAACLRRRPPPRQPR